MATIEPVADSTQLRRALGCFPSGVTAICALVDGQPAGMAASSFTSVSLSPPLVSVCMQHTSTTWPRLRGRPRLGLSILAEGHHDACRQLASKTGDRFAGTPWTALPDGSLYLHGSAAWLDCSVHSEVHAGDHTIVLLQIHGLHADPHTPPLIFHASTFRRLAAV
jgi:flavin reductase (DIM6/NTAB) family NADH-FMN oxidoreductase RutF